MSTNIIHETCVDLKEPSDYALAVSAARRVAGKIGFRESDLFLTASAVSELAANIIKYAGQGTVTLRILQGAHRLSLEVVAQDCGPGIADIEEAMGDHFSSSGSLGLGLPSVKRIMDEFEIRSEVGQGTVVIARKWIG